MTSSMPRRISRASNGSSRVRPRGRTELQCHFCGKAFFKTDHLHRHERSHTKERPFHCESCDKYFSRHDTLLRHLKKIHNAIDAPDLEASLGMAAENPDELREIGGLGPAVNPIFLVSGGNVTIEDGDYQVIDDSAIQNPGNTDEDCVPSLLDQSWWLDYDFDPNSLDMSLFEPMTLAEPFRQLNVPFNDCQLLPHDRTLPGKDIHKAWFTYIPDSRSSDTLQGSAALQSSTPADNNGAYELDENFRIRACEKLTTCLNVDPLPSTGLLNLSLKMYFDTFAPLFPIIHRHTFRPSSENSPLLLLMSALGCLLEGDMARCHGVRIFERFNNTVMASWGATMRSDSQEGISLVQAAVLGQLFGLLSGEVKHLSMVDAFHGTVIAWARKYNMFRQVNRYPNLENLGLSALEKVWKSWAMAEEVLRTVLGIYIIDTQIAGIFHHDPLLRHDWIASNLVAADEDVFNAPNAAEWKARILQRTLTRNTQLLIPLRSNGQFNSYVILQNISAKISEEQSRGRLDLASDEYERLLNDLMNWQGMFEGQLQGNTSEPDAFDLTTLWHASFMGLLADFNKLERALGRDGVHNVLLEPDMAYAVNWSKSVAADRCVLHAHAIQDKLSQMRLSTEPAMHVPHCAFLAGITSYSCMRFRRPAMLARYSPQDQPSSLRSPSDFPEFNIHGELERSQLFGNAPVLFENERGELLMHTFTPQRPIVMVGAEVFRQCCQVLQSIGHFEIARSYMKTLKELIYIEVQKWMHG